jgi:hypothetical protein
MRASTAYFVGAGTIIAAIVIGLGGGIVAGNIMNPITPKLGPDTSKVAQRAEAAATTKTSNIPATTNAPSERVQYLTGTRAFGTMSAAPAQAETQVDTKPDTKATQANAQPPTPPPPQNAAVEPAQEHAKSAPAQAAQPAEQQATAEPSSSPDNANAKARDSDVKRAASDRRRSERRERWAEHHRYSREARGMRDRTDWDDVARNVREDSDVRDYPSRSRSGFPQIRLFGSDDD